MRLQISSDIHISHWEAKSYNRRWLHEIFLPNFQTGADILVLAGDIVSLMSVHADKTEADLRAFCSLYKDVVYVAGNHEFWGTNLPAGKGMLKTLESRIENLTVLQDGLPQEVQGQRFIGDTGWYRDSRAMPIGDHHYIRDWHQTTRQHHLVMRNLRKHLLDTDVLVTHHTPDPQSISPEFKDSEVNDWFMSPDVGQLILEKQPVLAVHGHTHDPFDYHLGTTRVLCNPTAYPGERKDQQILVIEL